MTQLDEVLTRIVREDPIHTGAPDVAGLMRTGSRLRRRRQVAVAAGIGLAAAAVVAPFMLLGGGGSDTVGLSPADSPGASLTEAPRAKDKTEAITLDELQQRLGDDDAQVCGVAACIPNRGTYGSPEEGAVIGAQLGMGTLDGNTEVLYAARTEGYDTATGTPKGSVDVISTGIVVGGELRRTVWAFQPHEDPSVGPLGLYGGQRTISADGQAHFGVFGYVEGEHAQITASVDGETRPVSGLSTDVLPGYTVFYDTAPWNAAWSDRAQITYGVPNGPSCSVAECGTVG